MRLQHTLLAAASLTLALPLAAQEGQTSTTPAPATTPAPKSQDTGKKPDATKAGAEKTTTDAKAADTKERKADMTVVVVATRLKDSPYLVAGTTEAITLDDIRNSGAVTLGDTFKYTPGVGVLSVPGLSSSASSYSAGGDRGINVRGIEGDRVALLADGIAQPDEFTAGGSAANPGRIYFDPAVYGQVEVFKTAASSLYGSGALGGAVALVSVGPEQLLGKTLAGQALTNTGTYATANRSINNILQGAIGNGDWAGSIIYSFRKGTESETAGPRAYNPMNFEGHAAVGKVNRKYDTAKIEAVVDYYYYGADVTGINASGTTNMGPFIRYDYLTPSQEILRERLRFSLGAEILPEGRTALYDTASVTGYWQQTKSHVHSHDVTRITNNTPGVGTVTDRERFNDVVNDTEIRGLNASATKVIGGATVEQSIQYGVEFSFADNTMNFSRTENGNPAASAFVMAPSQVYRAGVFFSDKLAIGSAKKFVLTPSLRTDYYNVDPDNSSEYIGVTRAKAASYVNWSLSPGLSALYKVTQDINAFALYSMGTRNPTAGELSGIFNHAGTPGMGGANQIRILPNPDLKHETAHNFELGAQGNTEHHAFRVSGFYNIYNDFIETQFNTGQISDDGYQIYTSRNLSSVDIYGVELSWHWRVNKGLTGGIDGFRTGLTFAWTEGKQDVGGRSVPLDSVNPWELVGYIGYVHPEEHWGVRLTGTLVGKKSAKDISSTYAPVDSYFLLDVTAFYRFTKNWSLNAGINNLTNKEYYTWSSARVSSGMSSARFAQPGINGFVSLTASF